MCEHSQMTKDYLRELILIFRETKEKQKLGVLLISITAIFFDNHPPPGFSSNQLCYY